MANLDWQDILDRAVWTFVQTGLVSVGAAGAGFVNVAVWKTAAIAGGASVISLLKNVFAQTRAAKKA